MLPAKRVSPAMSFFSAGKYRQMLPSVCPGVCITWARNGPACTLSADQSENVRDVVTRINDHGFVRGFIANDRAIALQWANGEDFVNHHDS